MDENVALGLLRTSMILVVAGAGSCRRRRRRRRRPLLFSPTFTS